MTEFYAFANEEQCFVVLEDNVGELKVPAAANRIYTVGPVDFVQEQEYLVDEQIRSSPSQLPSILGRLNPGEWSLTVYVKPSGTAGTAPEHRVLYRCLLGKEEVVANSYVDYLLDSQVESFSLWVKKGHTVFAMRGATVESGEFNVSGDAIATVRFSGRYMEQTYAGQCLVNDTAAQGKTTLALETGAAQRFKVGSYIKIGTDDRNGAGYRITAVNYGADTITFTPALATNQGTNPPIVPLWPAAGTEVGRPVHGKLGVVKINNVDTVIFGSTVTITNNIKYYVDEKNNLLTAERYGRPGRRVVEGTLRLGFLRAGAGFFYRSGHAVTDALLIPAGSVAGRIMRISIPRAEYRSPRITGDEEFIQEVPFVAVASSTLNDEISIRFQ